MKGKNFLRLYVGINIDSNVDINADVAIIDINIVAAVVVNQP